MAKITGIPENEQQAAAKYFTMSNMAVLDIAKRFSKNIHTSYSMTDDVVAQDCGVGMAGEKRDWDKEVKKAKPGSYVATEWEKVKGDWTF